MVALIAMMVGFVLGAAGAILWMGQADPDEAPRLRMELDALKVHLRQAQARAQQAEMARREIEGLRDCYREKIAQLAPEGRQPNPRHDPPSCHWPCPVCTRWAKGWTGGQPEGGDVS